MAFNSGLSSDRRRPDPPDPLLDGLVEWWWLDSANAGNGAKGDFDLTENGTLTKNATGGPGNLGYTSGTAASNTNYYGLAHDAAFALGQYSVSFWFAIPATLPSTNQFYRAWLKGASEAAGVWGDAFINSGTSPTSTLVRFRADQAAVQNSSTFGSDPRGVWRHCVNRRTSTRRQSWIDGTMVYDAAIGTTASNTDNLRVMSNSSGANNPDMALYGWWARAITDDEIARLYGSGTPLTPANIGL
jgi:hypothetical protein